MVSRGSRHPSRRNVELAGLSVGLRRFRPGQRLIWNREVPARLCVILGGEMTESRGRGDLCYSKADIVYKPPEDRPRLRFGTAGLETLTLELGSKRLSALRDAGAPVDTAFSSRSPACTAVGIRICRELRADDELAHFALEGLALELLAAAWRSVDDPSRKEIPAWLQRVRRRIEDEAESRLMHTELAETAGVHPVYLAQKFRSCYGVSMGRFALDVRMKRAAERLAKTDVPLAEIAQSAGFYDQAHFSNAFKRATGLTPGEYRRSLFPKRVQQA